MMTQYPFIFSDERKYRLQRHLAFWLCWVIFFTVLYAYTPRFTVLPDIKRLPVTLVDAVVFMTTHIFFTYSLLYLVIPRFILKGKYIISVFLVIVLMLLTGLMSAMLSRYVLPEIRWFLFGPMAEEIHPVMNSSLFLSLLAGLRGGITIGGLAAAIKLMKHWYVKEQRNLQLQKENAAASLQLLKAQVHPHFLFNTLNNIYSFTQNSSPEASKMLTNLSSLLRYILYEGNQAQVSLQKELRMVQDYIDLERIRYDNRMELHTDIQGNTEAYTIAPLLLLPLIENCFKHGTSNVLEQPWIHLHVRIHDGQLCFKLMNGKVKEENPAQSIKGIGISNVKERLRLLYPGKHELVITNEEEVFIVNLKLRLEKKPKQKIIHLEPETEHA